MSCYPDPHDDQHRHHHHNHNNHNHNHTSNWASAIAATSNPGGGWGDFVDGAGQATAATAIATAIPSVSGIHGPTSLPTSSAAPFAFAAGPEIVQQQLLQLQHPALLSNTTATPWFLLGEEGEPTTSSSLTATDDYRLESGSQPDTIALDFSAGGSGGINGSSGAAVTRQPERSISRNSHYQDNLAPPARKRRRGGGGNTEFPGMYNFRIGGPSSSSNGSGGSAGGVSSSSRNSSSMALSSIPRQSSLPIRPPSGFTTTTTTASPTIVNGGDGAAIETVLSSTEHRPFSSAHEDARRQPPPPVTITITKAKVPREQQGIIILPTSSLQKRGYFAPKIWDSYRDVIKRLYLDEGQSLKEVAEYMEQQYNFKATERERDKMHRPKMYKTKFKAWGFGKNNTEKEAKQILYVKLARDRQGKPSMFSRNGKEIDLPKYLKRKGVTADQLFDLDAAGQLPSHVRCWTPPPQHRHLSTPSPRSLSPPAALSNQEKLLSHLRAAMNTWTLLHNSGNFGLEWQGYSNQHSANLVRCLVLASMLVRAGKRQQAWQTLEVVKLHLNKYAEDFNPATTMSLFASSAAWQDLRLTKRVWGWLAWAVEKGTVQGKKPTPLQPLFALVRDVVHQHDGVRSLHELLTACFEGIGSEMESRWGGSHPGVLTFWLGTGHDTGYHRRNRAMFEAVVARIPQLQAQVATALGPDSFEAWESRVYGFTALALLGTASVEANLAHIESALASMRAGRDPRTIPLQLTCLHMLYAFHRGRCSPGLGSREGSVVRSGGVDCDMRRAAASTYLADYVELKIAHLIRGNQDLTETLDSARRWYESLGDEARLAQVDLWRQQCEMLLEEERRRRSEASLYSSSSSSSSTSSSSSSSSSLPSPPEDSRRDVEDVEGEVDDVEDVDVMGGSSDTGQVAVIPDGVNVSELGTFTLQRIMRTMLYAGV